jgi:Flp pilus assembly protein TadB
MPEEDIHEIQEQAEEARRNPSLKPVSLTIAVFAVLLAAVSLLGHRTHIEEVLAQAKASDQWAYYQAKGIRRHNYEIFAELMSSTTSKDEAGAEKARENFLHQAERYRDEQNEIEAEARKLEQEVMVAGRKANRFNLGEVFLQIALVVTSITLLTSSRSYWVVGILFATVGVIVAATGLLVH